MEYVPAYKPESAEPAVSEPTVRSEDAVKLSCFPASAVFTHEVVAT